MVDAAILLLDIEPSIELIRAVVGTALRLRYPDVECPRYLGALEVAMQAEPPPFGTPEYGLIYQRLAVDPRWMAVSLITNAEREGDGAKRLWSLAACSDDRTHRRRLKRHACDESRHALLYLAMLDLAFPGAVSGDFASELRQLSPGFTMQQDLYPLPGSPYAKVATFDDFIQMNIAEIRTAIHHTLQRPVLARHCPPEKIEKITRIQDALLADELSHIAYTAVLIEALARDDPAESVESVFGKRLRDFNAITNGELGGNVFDCSVACCARRPTCRAKAPIHDSGQVLHQISSRPT